MVYALQVILHTRAQSFLLVQQELIDVWMGLAQTLAVLVLVLEIVRLVPTFVAKMDGVVMPNCLMMVAPITPKHTINARIVTAPMVQTRALRSQVEILTHFLPLIQLRQVLVDACLQVMFVLRLA